MRKKIIILVILVLLLAGGGFYAYQHFTGRSMLSGKLWKRTILMM